MARPCSSGAVRQIARLIRSRTETFRATQILPKTRPGSAGRVLLSRRWGKACEAPLSIAALAVLEDLEE
jgi:hypothetical protein